MANQNSLFAVAEEDQVPLDAPQENTLKFLIFECDNLRFGANVEYVVEIITNQMITPLPMVPDYVSGILNLRGQIIPVIDIRLRLGKERREGSSCIVLNLDGTMLGILVDFVAQMVDIPKEHIFSMPSHSTQKLVSGMCSLPDGGTMMVLDCMLLLEQ